MSQHQYFRREGRFAPVRGAFNPFTFTKKVRLTGGGHSWYARQTFTVGLGLRPTKLASGMSKTGVSQTLSDDAVRLAARGTLDTVGSFLRIERDRVTGKSRLSKFGQARLKALRRKRGINV